MVYPRACGGTAPPTCQRRAQTGLSPRVRGNPRDKMPGAVRSRSIPARAGEPALADRKIRQTEVYPRACGGTLRHAWHGPEFVGLSPRVRGNRLEVRARVMDVRSIPARAGEPAQRCTPALHYWVYPRACGGTATETHHYIYPKGLSPRVRGNHQCPAATGQVDGSIPARAGEPG